MTSLQPCTRPWRNDIPRAVAAAVAAHQPRWCCGCWSSSTSGTGVMRCWNARCEPIWCIVTLPASAAARWDAKTMGRWGVALGPEVLKQVHERMVKIALEKGVTTGRRMRVDTTVVETDVHHPTDSTLLGDGVRVLTRMMKQITKIAGAIGTKLRDRNRGVKFRLLEIGRVV